MSTVLFLSTSTVSPSSNFGMSEAMQLFELSTYVFFCLEPNDKLILAKKDSNKGDESYTIQRSI